ncbi:TPA: hypothetical protein QDB16_000488 [Burkholderia vietnamiensis]|nr:hypothetical protein [Burkholderia vietnamiensis]
MQKFDFMAPASGAPQVINAPGRYLKYVTGTAGGNDTGLIVTPGGKPGSKILLYPGQAVTLPDDGTAGPNAWTVANAVGQGQISGAIVVGNGRIDDNTLQGTVQVVDGGKARTMSNNAYIGYGQQAAVAAQFSQVQLWNPAANPNRLVLEQIQLYAGSLCTMLLESSQVQLATLVDQGQAKKLGGTASAAGVFAAATAVAPPTNTALGGYSLAANVTTTASLREPIVIPPGYGLIAVTPTANVGTTATFEWYEEPNV